MLFRPANKCDGYLLVGRHHAGERLSCQDSICEFFADLCWRHKVAILIIVVFFKIPETLQKFEFKWRWLRSIVHNEGGIFATFAHVECPKIEGTLLAAALLKHDRNVLLHARCSHLDRLFGTFLAVNFDRDFTRNHVGVRSCQTNSYPLNLIWLYVELDRFNAHGRFVDSLLGK